MCYGDCPVYWRVFSSISGLYARDASSAPCNPCDGKKMSPDLPNLLGPELPRLRPSIQEGNFYSINYFLNRDYGKCHLSLHMLYHLPGKGLPFLLA